MVIIGAIPPVRATVLFVAQMLGSISASALAFIMFPTALNVRTTLGGDTTIIEGVFIELVLTAELVFTIFMLAAEKHKATFIAPVGIGLALFVAELVGVYYTGGSLNPARSFGPCVVTHIFDKEHWIYCKFWIFHSLPYQVLTWIGVGPFGGSIAAALFYKFIKILEYETANPGQDGDDENDPTKNPDHELNVKRQVDSRDGSRPKEHV
jgi:aquaporin rerated protein, other eukaryote